MAKQNPNVTCQWCYPEKYIVATNYNKSRKMY